MKDLKKLFQSGLAFFLLLSNVLAIGQAVKVRSQIDTHPSGSSILTDHQPLVNMNDYHVSDLVQASYNFDEVLNDNTSAYVPLAKVRPLVVNVRAMDKTVYVPLAHVRPLVNVRPKVDKTVYAPLVKVQSRRP